MRIEGRWAEVRRAIAILAIDPRRVGGLLLRGRPGPMRDLVIAWLMRALPDGVPLVRMPVHITEDRLVGGLALAETLRHGRPIVEPGVLARADGGLVVCATAERMPIATASVVCATLDSGEIVVERDGLSVRSTARIALVLLDEGSDGESVPASLRDRVALDVDLDALPILSSGEVADLLNGPALEAESLRPAVMAARGRMVSTTIGGAALDALSEGCVELGIGSLRAPVLAAHVATLHAALEGRGTVEADDLSFAARLGSTKRDPPSPRARRNRRTIRVIRMRARRKARSPRTSSSKRLPAPSGRVCSTDCGPRRHARVGASVGVTAPSASRRRVGDRLAYDRHAAMPASGSTSSRP
jgi:magnesium chelatase subunit D